MLNCDTMYERRRQQLNKPPLQSALKTAGLLRARGCRLVQLLSSSFIPRITVQRRERQTSGVIGWFVSLTSVRSQCYTPTTTQLHSRTTGVLVSCGRSEQRESSSLLLRSFGKGIVPYHQGYHPLSRVASLIKGISYIYHDQGYRPLLGAASHSQSVLSHYPGYRPII